MRYDPPNPEDLMLALSDQMADTYRATMGLREIHRDMARRSNDRLIASHRRSSDVQGASLT